MDTTLISQTFNLSIAGQKKISENIYSIFFTLCVQYNWRRNKLIVNVNLIIFSLWYVINFCNLLIFNIFLTW